MTARLRLPMILIAGLALTAVHARGATQYWDTDASAGIQGGNGAWSTSDANWSSTRAGSALSGWTGGNDAWFVLPSNGLPSVITLTNGLSVNSVIITGSVYSIVVTNGGQLLAGGTDSVIGASASNNTVSVIGGANGVSVWELGTGASKKMLTLGTGNNADFTNNALIIDGAGVPGSAVVTNMAQFRMGENGATFPGGSDHRLVIRRGGRLYSVGGALGYDRYSSRNTATLTDPGTLWDLGGGELKVGSPIANGSDTFNTMTIADQAVVTNAGSVKVHYGITSGNDINAYNQLIITNGGKLYSGAAAGYLGDGSSNSIVVAGGAGVTSLWSSAAAFTLGSKGNNNLLLIDGLGSTGSAVVTGMNGMTLGATVYALGNILQVRGGGMLSFSNTLTSGGTNGLILFESGAQVALSGPGAGIQLNKGNVDISGSGTLVDFGGKQLSFGHEPNQSVAIRNGAVVLNCLVSPDGSVTLLGKYTRLDVTGGGRLTSTFQNPMYLPQYPSCVTTTVSGAGSVFNAGGSLISVGSYRATSSNTLLIANGGIVTNANSIVLAHDSGSTTFRNNWGNSVVITNGGKLFTFAGAISYVGSNRGLGYHNNSVVVRDPGSVWTALGDLMIGYNTTCTGNAVLVDNGGSITNVAALTFSGAAGKLVVTNGGGFFSTGATAVSGFNNEIRIVGSNSVWNPNGATVNLGATGTNNTLAIDQGGAVNAIGTLTLTAGHSLQILGGTLSATNAAVATGQAITIGDGVQPAVLKGLGGSLAFANGLRVNTNATLTGAGQVGGAGAGVSLLNGGAVNPGAGAAGSMTLSGSNLTWNTGGLLVCDITNLNLGPGVGWDLLNVSSQLVLNGSGLVIKMNSLGAPAANFDSGKNYNLRILTYGTQSGYDPANITVNTDDFQDGGTWTLTNALNALWLVYRGAPAPAAATFTWKVPNSGPWSDPANWTNNAAPTAGGDPGWILEFGDNGTRYAASNNLAGAFLLNQLRFTGTTTGTNLILGNLLAFTNANARIDYETGAGGLFIVSNTVRLTTDTTIGGNAIRGTLTLAGIVTNLGTCTKNGTWTLGLGGANDFSGPLVVDSPDGIVKTANSSTSINPLNGLGAITISNGMIFGTTAQADGVTFANGRHNRRGLVKGGGSVWTNGYNLIIAKSATNVQFVVDGGRVGVDNTTFFTIGSRDGVFMLTNGGVLYCTGNSSAAGDASTNCQVIVTGTNSYMYRNQMLYASQADGVSNTILVEKGGLIYGGTSFGLQVAGSQSQLIITNGGRVNLTSILGSGALSVRGSNNTALITGSGSLVAVSGSAVASVASGPEFGNVMTITDNGMVSGLNLQMAQGGAYSNALVVTNSGKLSTYATAQYIVNATNGFTYNNRLIVSGPGSSWNVSGQPLTLCATLGAFTGTQNRLIVENGGLLTNAGSLVVAMGTNAINNSVTVDGGVLQAVSLVWSNPLANAFTLTGGGQVSLVNLVLTNANHGFALNGGTLSVRNAWSSNGLPFVAGDGAQAAALNLLPGAGTNVFADGLVVTNSATLTGAGLLQANGTVFGTLSPGLAVGIFTNNGTLALKPGAATRIELAAYTAPGAGWDCVAVTNGTLLLDGSLSVLLTGGFLPTNTQSFLILTNQGPAGVSNTFANLQAGMIPAYSNVPGKVAGLFQVKIGPQGVVLDSFTPLRTSPGTVILIR